MVSYNIMTEECLKSFVKQINKNKDKLYVHIEYTEVKYEKGKIILYNGDEPVAIAYANAED